MRALLSNSGVDALVMRCEVESFYSDVRAQRRKFLAIEVIFGILS